MSIRIGKGPGEFRRWPVSPVAFCLLFCLATFIWPFQAKAQNLTTRFLGLTADFDGATGGIVRVPNDLQPKNKDNLFGEGWLKLALPLRKAERAKTSVFVLGNFVADSKGFAYNNTAKVGVGLSHSIQASDALNITFLAGYEWFMERRTDTRRSGIKLATTYYYYRRWDAKPGDSMVGLAKSAIVLKSYGSLQYPGSLLKGDDNIVLTLGGELSMDLNLPKSKWIVSPFADFDFAWDKDQNNYNNKLIPGVGIKIRYPLKGGELFAGVRLGADYRWVKRTLDAGPMAFFGWYKGF